MQFEKLEKYILSFPEVEQKPHFQKESYRIGGKIFITIDHAISEATIKLSLVDQDVFYAMLPDTVFPVPNKWGAHGWTVLRYQDLDKTVCQDVVRLAYCLVAPSRLASLFQGGF